MYAKLFARDVAIGAAIVGLWAVGARWSAGTGPLADATGVLLGVALGLLAFPVHEWGHFAGALATRSQMTPSRSLRSFFSFSFDSKHNTQAQFLAMTFGGWVGTGLSVAVAYAALPDAWLATRVARGMVLLSLALVVAAEIPLVARALWTGRIPPIETQRAPEEAERAAA